MRERPKILEHIDIDFQEKLKAAQDEADGVRGTLPLCYQVLMLVLWQERAERFDASTLLYLAVVRFNEV